LRFPLLDIPSRQLLGSGRESLHSLSSLKIKEIETMGWTPVIFEDRYYLPESAFNDLILRSPESNRFEGV
jgi:hypothetical protein